MRLHPRDPSFPHSAILHAIVVIPCYLYPEVTDASISALAPHDGHLAT